MRNKFLLPVGLAVLTLAGAYRFLWSNNPAPTKGDSRAMPPIVRQTAPEPDTRTAISPREMRFLLPEHQQAVLALDAAVRRSPDPGWTQQPGERYAPAPFDPTKWEATWKGPGCELSIGMGNTTSWAESFQVTARRSPPEGWWAGLLYSRSAEEVDERHEFHLELTPPSELRSPDPATHIGTLALSPGDSHTQVQAQYDFAEYRVLVRSRDHYPVRVTADEIRAYLDSPETFRQAVLGELKQLRRQGTDQIRSGVGFELAVDRRSGTPTFLVPEPVRRQADARFQSAIDTQVRLIDEHYATMHAVLVAAFPGFRSLFVPSTGG